ncbi:MAG: hypothetical protein COT73_05100 [Bdellovibrio sp. CG10_big_fil_rev_8_21_14_0_10_47_8]|nr:MAG: hypothetical protein COT73_05100 [Bdellovibrio sp. CG10_big_fil_rev_8_21_14_0_10_47_8]
MKNQSGFVTTEFLFAVIIAFGLTMLTFALTFTLSTVEIVQYTVYSAARAQAAGNFDVEAQKKTAQSKYEKLIAGNAFGPLFQNGWYTVSKPSDLEIRAGNGDNFEGDYRSSNYVSNTFQGVRATLVAKILEMRLPFVGSVTPEDDGFKARLTGFLIREPSQKECFDFMEARKEALWTVDGQNRFSRFRKSTDYAVSWEDNGC